MITSIVDAYKHREVEIVDIPNAFVQTKNEGEKAIIKIKGEMALILVEACPELYKPYLIYEKGVPTLYVEVDKAIYGMLQSSLLFYKKLTKDLIK